jgi:hypothetical protein
MEVKMSCPENRLSQLLVIPDFLSRKACDDLRGILNRLPDSAAKLLLGDLLPLEPRFEARDLTDPAAMLDAAKKSQAAAVLAMTYLPNAARLELERAKSIFDIGADLEGSAVRTLDAAAADPEFYGRVRNLITLPDELREGFDELVSLGILAEDGTLKIKREPTDDERFLLFWFHALVIQRTIFAGSLAKSNRLLSDAAQSGRLSRGLKQLFEDLPDSKFSVLDPLGRGTWAGVRLALWRVFSSPTNAQALLAKLSGSRSGSATGGTAPAKHEAIAVQQLLHERFPDDILAPGTSAVARGHRHAVTLENPTIQAPCRALVERLIRERIERHYGVEFEAIHGLYVLKYKEGGFHVPHNDSEEQRLKEGELRWVRVLPRDVSILIYLSDSSDYTGGSLYFPELYVAVRPQLGMAVTFPSDHRFVHAAEPITSGTRYAIASWISCKTPLVGAGMA